MQTNHPDVVRAARQVCADAINAARAQADDPGITLDALRAQMLAGRH